MCVCGGGGGCACVCVCLSVMSFGRLWLMAVISMIFFPSYWSSGQYATQNPASSIGGAVKIGMNAFVFPLRRSGAAQVADLKTLPGKYRAYASTNELPQTNQLSCHVLAQGAEVVECACMIELKALNGVGKLHERHPDVPVWSLISEDILTVKGEESS